MPVINPIARLFQCLRADGRIDIGAHGRDSDQFRQGVPQFTGSFEDEISTHGIACQPKFGQAILVRKFCDDGSVIAAETAVIQSGREMFGSAARALVHAYDVEADAIGLDCNTSHISGITAAFESMD